MKACPAPILSKSLTVLKDILKTKAKTMTDQHNDRKDYGSTIRAEYYPDEDRLELIKMWDCAHRRCCS